MSKIDISRPIGTDGKGMLGSDNVTPINDLEKIALNDLDKDKLNDCLLYTSPSPRDRG